jgi:hypothetical protein
MTGGTIVPVGAVGPPSGRVAARRPARSKVKRAASWIWARARCLAGPDQGRNVDKMDQLAAQLREISAWLDEAALRKAQAARAAEITCMHIDPEDPDAMLTAA